LIESPDREALPQATGATDARVAGATRSRLETWAVVLIVVVGALPFMLSVDADPDLWWHVRTGEAIVDQGGLPQFDEWSFTASEAEWTNHEWLTDVIFYGAYNAGGDIGLLLLRNMLFVAIVAGLVVVYGTRVRQPLLILGLVLLTVPILGTFINVRAHSFSYALVVWSVVALDRVRDGRWRFLTVLPVIMALWVNLHGGFLLGLGLIGLSLLALLFGLDGVLARPVGRARRLVIAAGLATLAVTVLNPNGIGLFRYLVAELGANHSIVSEWQRPEGAQLIYFWAYLLVPLMLWVAARRWRRVSLPIMLALTAFSTMRHARFFVLMGLFGSMVAVDAVGTLVERIRESGRLREGSLLFDSKAAVASLVALTLVLGAPLIVGIGRGESGVTVDTSRYPVEAVQWLETSGLGPNVAGPLPYGGYMIWHLGPDVKVAVDGRNLTVYDDEWVDRYLRSLEAGSALDVLDESQVDAWLLPIASPQIPALQATGRWSIAYRDPVAAVLTPGQTETPVEGPAPPQRATFP